MPSVATPGARPEGIQSQALTPISHTSATRTVTVNAAMSLQAIFVTEEPEEEQHDDNGSESGGSGGGVENDEGGMNF